VRKSQPKKISIRVDLEGEEADRCKSLKTQRGLKNSSELIRQLISEAAAKLVEAV
jgi:hypothetical protein